MDDRFCVVNTTFSDRDEALQLARKLLQKRLAACAQISSAVESLYWWQGDVASDNEYVLTLKTVRSLYPQLAKIIIEHHSYETPEIIVTPIINGHKEYLDWIAQETQVESA